MTSETINVLLDTNALWMDKPAKQRLLQACRDDRLRVYLPALVLVERERQLIQRDHQRAAKGKPTEIGRSVRFFRRWVAQWAFDLAKGQDNYRPILAFDEDQAKVVSEAWEEWLDAQEADYLLIQLNAQESTQELRRRFKGKRKTLADLDWTVHKVDWSIAAVARQTGWLLVTNDQDAPFQQPDVRTMDVDEFAGQYLTAK